MKPLPYRTVQQESRHTRINPSGKTENHIVVPKLLFERFHCRFNEIFSRPVSGAAADAYHEVAQYRRTALAVMDFRMELYTPDLLTAEAESCILHALRGADHLCTLRQTGDCVSMRHPHRGFGRNPREKRVGSIRNLEGGAAIFARTGRSHIPAAVIGEPLSPIADAEQRHTASDGRQVRLRRISIPDGSGTSGQDHTLDFRKVGRYLVERPYFAIDTDFTHPARDELGVLRAEVENQYLIHLSYS